MTSRALTIGRLATAAGVNVETIRYYQKRGLLKAPTKPTGGFRHYPKSDIDRLRFIKRAQKIGFSLEEIIQLLALGSDHCPDVRTLAEEKRAHIQQQIQGLETIQSVLDELIDCCQKEPSTQNCGFIETLSQKGFLET